MGGLRRTMHNVKFKEQKKIQRTRERCFSGTSSALTTYIKDLTPL